MTLPPVVRRKARGISVGSGASAPSSPLRPHGAEAAATGADGFAGGLEGAAAGGGARRPPLPPGAAGGGSAPLGSGFAGAGAAAVAAGAGAGPSPGRPLRLKATDSFPASPAVGSMAPPEGAPRPAVAVGAGAGASAAVLASGALSPPSPQAAPR
jgi:hypothetical protein